MFASKEIERERVWLTERPHRPRHVCVSRSRARSERRGGGSPEATVMPAAGLGEREL